MNRRQLTPCASHGAKGKEKGLYSPPEQPEITYIYPKNQGLSVAPESIFQVFFLPLHHGSSCKLFHFQYSASILCKHL